MGMRAVALALAWLLTFAAAVPARAAWLQASSAHFVVYADDNEAKIRRIADQLERYHSAMEFLTGYKEEEAPSPSARVTVFVLASESEVRRLYGEGSKYVGGFYQSRAGGSVAFVPRLTGGSKDLDFSMIALLHEYAHHFMITASSVEMPRWYSEGGAEFFASASFAADGSISLGRPAQHRAGELFLARDVPLTQLLDEEAYQKNKGKGYDAFYGRAWLLFHYLTFEKSRQGQLSRYLAALPRQGALGAAREAFGDLEQLERDLDKYLGQSRIMAFTLPPRMLNPGPIDVRPLRPGEAAIMPVMIRSRRGVTEETASQVAADARAVAAKFPDDPAVQAALAEAEYDAKNDGAAIAAADKALAADRTQVNAYLQKGYALFRQARDTAEAVDFRAARAPFVALNRLENDHPLPLMYFYLSYLWQGQTPTPLAVRGLERAVEVAPFDIRLRMMLATEQIRSGRRAEARANLALIAGNPHGGGPSEVARAMIKRLDDEPGWNGQGLNTDPIDNEAEAEPAPK